MSIVYEDWSPPFTGRPTPYHEQPATKNYLRHFANLLFLQAVMAAPRDVQEKIQASREMTIAERKMEHWRKHPNFRASDAEPEIARLRREWRR